MYKKIKNGSFMNLFWFIVCLMPLIFLIVFTSQYVFENRNYNSTYKNIINENNLSTSTSLVTIKNSNTFNYKRAIGNALITFNLEELNDEFYLYTTFNSNNSVNHLTLDKISLDYFTNRTDLEFESITYENDLNNYLFKKNNFDGINFDNYSKITFIFKTPISNTFPFEFSAYNYNNTILFDNVSNIINNNESTFEIYLNSFYSTFETNGFINNTLIQVINYFNVSNVYMQLAILYIEYFIIIQLLHLFVDFMLLIPNICHKFMEKVGGERD